MSWLSDRWGKGPSIKGLESSIKGTGHTIGEVADNPWTKAALAAALTATGVGAPAAAALLASEGALGGALKPGGNFGSTLGGAASGAIAGGGGALAGKALGALGSAAGDIPGVSGIESAAGGLNGALQKIPGVTGLESVLGSAGNGLKSALGNGTSGVTSLLSSFGGAPGGGIDWGKLADVGLGAAGVLNTANLQQKAGNLSNQAVQTAEDAWNQKAPLRAAGVTGMLNAAQYNPYSRAPGAAPAPAAGGTTPLPTTAWR